MGWFSWTEKDVRDIAKEEVVKEIILLVNLLEHQQNNMEALTRLVSLMCEKVAQLERRKGK